MKESQQYRLAEDRPLSQQERTLLNWLIEHGTPEAQQFATQLESVRVVGHCGCGCPTLDLATDKATEPTTGASQILADFSGTTPEKVRVGVILHAREGKLSELEVYSVAGDVGAFSLPDLSTLS